MSNSYNIERERLEDKSINRNSAQAQQRRQQYKKRKAKSKRQRAANLVIGFLLVLSLGVGSKLAVNQLSPYFDGSYINQSYTIGNESVLPNTHRTSDNEHYWYDVDSIARTYDDASMDFDSFVYGTYTGMDTNIVRNMNDLFWQLKMLGVTDYNQFTDYVMSMGCVKVVDGQSIADIDAWKQLMKRHIRVGNELMEAYTEVGRFDGTRDFDIYVHQVYEIVGWNNDSKLSCMDDLMRDLCTDGYTTHTSFFSYCQSKGFIKEKDGTQVIDESAYQKGYRRYVQNLEEVDRLEEEIRQFRGESIAPVEEKGLGK